MQDFKLDRNSFRAHAMKEAKVGASGYKNLTWQERLVIADYLNSEAYHYQPGHPPRMDRTKFTAKSQGS